MAVGAVMAELRRRDVVRAFLRSFGLQAAWSFEGMQSVGFAYAMDPVLERLYGRGHEHRAAVRRHLEFFNTHPFLASAILGCVIRLEEDGAEGLEEGVRRLKSSLMGPYGAIGDVLYWGSLKPLLLVIFLHAAYGGALWAPFAFVACFTAANLVGRVYGFWAGYRKGLGIIEAVSRLDLLAWAQRTKALCAVLLGTLLALSAGPTLLDEWDLPAWVWGPASGVLAVFLARGVLQRVPVVWTIYLAVLISAVIVAST